MRKQTLIILVQEIKDQAKYNKQTNKIVWIQKLIELIKVMKIKAQKSNCTKCIILQN